MRHAINTKVILSGAMIAFAAAVIIGATYAFFSDTETSTGNVFAAGELDLQVDSEAHYAGLVCQNDVWVDNNPPSTTRPDLVGTECVGTWSLKNLTQEDIFFSLDDIKPGDEGENTISLHVFDNDAWVRMVIDQVSDDDNLCTEPEGEAGDATCGDDEGELQENMEFSIWLDQGSVNGFQCSDGNEETVDEGARCEDDEQEGDNIRQEQTEPLLVTSGPLDPGGETLNIWEGLGPVYSGLLCGGSGNLEDVATTCPGLGPDGQLLGSFTYYFGLAWTLPDEVGNIVQTDSMSANISFEAEQHRNNPTPFTL